MFLDNEPVPVHNVVFEGNNHTSTSFLEKKVRNIAGVSTVQSLVGEVSSSIADISSTNLFSQVDAVCDASATGVPGDVDVIVTLKEKSRLSLTAGANQSTDGSATTGYATANLRNPFGHGENLAITTSLSNEGLVEGRSFNAVNVRLSNLSILPNSRSTNSLSVFHEIVNKSYYSALLGSSTGASAGITDATGRHTFELEGSHRVFTLAPDHAAQATPQIIAETVAPSVKNSAKYTYRADGRVMSGSVPLDGALHVTRVELAGLGGDVAFAKVEAMSQHVRPISASGLATLAVTMRAGIVRSFGALASAASAATAALGVDTSGSGGISGDAGACAVMGGTARSLVATVPAVPIADRFFHNHLFVRGVPPREVSPCDAKSNALGGDTYVSAGAALSSPIPGYEGLGLRPHVFANVGAVAQAIPLAAGTTAAAIGDTPGAGAAWGGAAQWLGITGLASAMRASVGAGLTLPMGFGCIEMNVASQLVVKGQPTLGKPGVSLGISVDW